MSRPGEFPYDAGIRASGYTERPWTMRQYAGFGDARATNERFRFLLGLGETGLSLAFDLPTQFGLDPDDPQACDDVGRVGVSVATVDDLAAVFAGIALDEVSVAFTINATAPIILAMWVVAAAESGVDPARLRGTLQNEMLKEFLARKAYIFDLRTSFRYSLDVIEHCIRHLPGVFPTSISGGHAREAGADRNLEVACGIADGEEYLRGMLARGFDADRVVSQFSFIFGAHLELLAEAAKFRAIRRLYARRLMRRFGVRDERAARMRIQVNTFGSALAREEPLDNVARATVQAVAAVLGGVQSLHVCSFDEAHRTPSPLAVRLSLRTQQILAEETDLRRHVDPLGGSPVIESLAAGIEAGATAWLDRIDEHGGMLESLRSGWLEREIEEMAYRDRGPKVGTERPIAFPQEDALVRPDGTDARGGEPRRVERRQCTAELARVRRDAEDGRNVLPALIEAAGARATVGQMRAALEPAPVPSGR